MRYAFALGAGVDRQSSWWHIALTKRERAQSCVVIHRQKSRFGIMASTAPSLIPAYFMAKLLCILCEARTPVVMRSGQWGAVQIQLQPLAACSP